MEPKFQTSFIPKKSFATPTKKKRRQFDLLTLIGLFFLLLSIVLSAGVFLYGKYTTANIDRKARALEEAKTQYNPELISELSRLSKKMTVSERLLANHVSASAIFSAVEESTLRSIKFDDMTFTYGPDKITIAMKGNAGGFSSIALQSDVFGRNKLIRNPVFSELNLDSNGRVNFLFTAEIDPQSVLYRNNLGASN
jgi:hypothetical protein